MFAFNTKQEMLASLDLNIGSVYLAPDTEGVSKMWRVISGLTPGSSESEPKKGDRENMLETCTGISNAFVKNISGSFNSNGIIDGSVNNFYTQTSSEIPTSTIHYNAEDNQWRIQEGGVWYTMDFQDLEDV